MLVTSIEGNSQRLDGGAMFGNAPRVVWKDWAPPDEWGRIALSCRCFLVQHAGRNVLLETGVGAFFSPGKRQRYGVIESGHRLLEAMAARGLSDVDIDLVILSHLHFDHAGGLLASYEAGTAPRLLFPRAQFVVSAGAWRRALQPHPRDRASFIPELPSLLDASGRLLVLEEGTASHPAIGEELTFFQSEGHTPGMLLTIIQLVGQRAVFCADLVPGAPWVHAPITMGYDRFPERLIDEKLALYDQVGLGTWLLFTHDPQSAAGRLARDERGRFFIDQALPSLDSSGLGA